MGSVYQTQGFQIRDGNYSRFRNPRENRSRNQGIHQPSTRMIKENWLTQVKANEEVLRNFIARYHPINLLPNKDTDVMDKDITAPQAERACNIVRAQIRKESFERPDIQFNTALLNNDDNAIYNLLQSAWFGVPESTSCWNIPGFSIAVNLLDDPIEEDWQPE